MRRRVWLVGLVESGLEMVFDIVLMLGGWGRVGWGFAGVEDTGGFVGLLCVG